MPQSPEEFLRSYRSEDEQAADDRAASQWPDELDEVIGSTERDFGPSRLGSPRRTTAAEYQPGTVFDDDLESLQQAAQRSVNRAVGGPIQQDPLSSGRSFAGESLNDFLADLNRQNQASVAASSTTKGALQNAFKRAYNNPLELKRDLATEFVARIDQQDNPNAITIANEVFDEGKRQGFNPAGSWRNATDRDYREGGGAMQSMDRYFSEKQGRFNPKAVASNALTKTLESIKGTTDQALSRVSYPKFIADAFALRNPVVEAGGPVTKGSFINPQAAKFLKEFKPKTSIDSYSTSYKSPFGTTVSVTGGEKYGYNLAFEGPFGYKRSGEIRKEINRELEEANRLESKGLIERANTLRDVALNKQELLNEPLRSPALRYTLGSALENVPVGSTLEAAPIGEASGSRARIYSALTNNALATDRGVEPNRDRMPTDEEFRAVREGYDSPVSYSAQGMRRRNFSRGRISSGKLSPTTWKNVKGEERNFDPASLKDEMIRETYGLSRDADVSNLRSAPLSLLQRTDRIDFTKPVITTDSPIYKFRKGLKAGVGVGAADLIPTPEAVRSFYSGKPQEGIRNMAETFISSLPVSAAVGGTVAAAPVLAPLAAGAGAGLTGVALAKAGNEVVRQQTGEDTVSKVRQFLGTADRSGISSRSPRGTTLNPVTPTIRPLTEAQRIEQNRQRTRSELERRVDLAKERFNPLKGEFGLSEIIFGR